MTGGDNSSQQPQTLTSPELEKKVGGGEDGSEEKFVCERPPNHPGELWLFLKRNTLCGTEGYMRRYSNSYDDCFLALQGFLCNTPPQFLFIYFFEKRLLCFY
jgi:hypothetical protein